MQLNSTNNSFSRIEQNGHLFNKVLLSRGCRKGGPISQRLFFNCAELLSRVIWESNYLWRIKIGETDIKLLQYDADTTLLG